MNSGSHDLVIVDDEDADAHERNGTEGWHPPKLSADRFIIFNPK
jgi:hypothetical protein